MCLLISVNDGFYYEVLLCLKDCDGIVIEFNVFFFIVEWFEMNVKIDKWVIFNIFEYLYVNFEYLVNLKCCSINLNCYLFVDRDFKLFVLNVFDKYVIFYDKICFEVIEFVVIIKMEDILCFM